MIKYFIDGVPHYIADDKAINDNGVSNKPSLREYRKKAGLTQAQLAKELGVSKACVGMWEIGCRKPDIITLKKLAKILGCTADELLEPIKI